MDSPCVLVVGNLTEGFRFIGPFADFDAAAQFSEGVDVESWVDTLQAPDKGASGFAAGNEQEYLVLSPDGFPIHVEDTYLTREEAHKACAEWVEGYRFQGFYSTFQRERISLDELAGRCRIVEVEKEDEDE